MDYKQILDDIIELNECITIVTGYGDIILCLSEPQMGCYIFRSFTEDNFWVVMGKSNPQMIIEAFSEDEANLDRDGEYSFKAVIKLLQNP